MALPGLRPRLVDLEDPQAGRDLRSALSEGVEAGSEDDVLGDAVAGLVRRLDPRRSRLEVFERLAEIPPYNEDIEEPEPVVALRASIAFADVVLVATPEYNGSVPGQLKNALDWASRPFPDNALRDKPVAVIGASTGLFGALWAQAELRKVLTTIGARVLERELPVGQAHQAFDSDDRLVDDRLRTELTAVLAELQRTAGATTHAGTTAA